MKKLFLTLMLALGISFITNANSLCNGNLKYTFSNIRYVGGMGDSGDVVLIVDGNEALKGTFIKDRQNNIRIKWNTGYDNVLTYVSDGVFSDGRNTFTECQ